MRLTVTHTVDKDNAKVIEAGSAGWPRVLSSLKSFLETGRPWPARMSNAAAQRNDRPLRAYHDKGGAVRNRTLLTVLFLDDFLNRSFQK